MARRTFLDTLVHSQVQRLTRYIAPLLGAGYVSAGLAACADIDTHALRAGRTNSTPDGRDSAYDSGFYDARFIDAGKIDSGADASSVDAGKQDASFDAGMKDASMMMDAGRDAGMTDAAMPDAGVTDAGYDAGTIRDGGDASTTDAGMRDSGRDAGAGCLEVEGYADTDGDGIGVGEEITYCTSDGSLPAGASAQTGDCAPDDRNLHTTLAGYENNDEDEFTLDTLIERCTNGSYSSTFVQNRSTVPDCDDMDSRRGELQTRYLDTDEDTIGAGAVELLCDVAGTPRAGYSLTDADCAPVDGTRWQNLSGFQDVDRDTFTLPDAETICSGTELPSGYRAAASATIDCDDTDARRGGLQTRYQDADGDTVGAGAAELLCDVAGTARAGYSLVDTDCATGDASRWEEQTVFRDADRDSFTLPDGEIICVGASLPVGYRASASAVPDCNDSDAARAEPQTRYQDIDGDGRGAGAAELLCDIPGVARVGYSLINSDCAPEDVSLHTTLSGFPDRDGDSYTTARAEEVCTDGTTLPPRYHRERSAVVDCDDSNPALNESRGFYPDTDGDGIGAGDEEFLCGSMETPPAGYSRTGTDCAPADRTRHTTVDGFLDRDSDTYTITASEPLCTDGTLPSTHRARASVIPDCNDSDAARAELQTRYRDADEDGVGAGAAELLCDLPGVARAGYSLTNTDCAPSDGTRWQNLTGFADGDGDRYTVAAGEPVCSGESLPAPYRAAASPVPDCDDGDPRRTELEARYSDADRDGIGAGDVEFMCDVTGVPRTGYSLTNTDCAPDDRTAWTLMDGFPDRDSDTYTLSTPVRVCGGDALPAGYRSSASATPDCDDTDATKNVLRARFPDADGDGVGAGAAEDLCDSDGVARAGYSLTNTDCAVADGSRWRNLTGFRDADGDAFTLAAEETACSGTGLPAGYRSTASATVDCDDMDSRRGELQTRYADTDGDGVGAGAAELLCDVTGTPRAGYSLTNMDCAPADGTQWENRTFFRDADGDIYTVGDGELTCAGVGVPDGYRASASATTDCNDADSAINPGASEDRDASGGCNVADLDGKDNDCDRTIEEICMATVSSGAFTMGCNPATYPDCGADNPAHGVTLTYGFRIDVFEVTNRQYTECVSAGGCTAPGAGTRNMADDVPVTRVTWDQAGAYCTFAGKRLPTEAEWEKAARDGDGRRFSPGATADCSTINYNNCVGNSAVVGSYPAGPYGTHDQSGNVREWVSDWYGSLSTEPATNPTGPADGTEKIYRGGHYTDVETDVTTYTRNGFATSTSSKFIGFRCAQDE